MSIAPVFARGLDRPFLLMGDPQTNHHTVPSWPSLWDRSGGWHADLTLNGASRENSYKDAVWLIPQIARQIGLPDSFVTRAIGTVEPAGAVRAEQADLSAFFDRARPGQPSAGQPVTALSPVPSAWWDDHRRGGTAAAKSLVFVMDQVNAVATP